MVHPNHSSHAVLMQFAEIPLRFLHSFQPTSQIKLITLTGIMRASVILLLLSTIDWSTCQSNDEKERAFVDEHEFHLKPKQFVLQQKKVRFISRYQL